jgi:hypothetical protein
MISGWLHTDGKYIKDSNNDFYFADKPKAKPLQLVSGATAAEALYNKAYAKAFGAEEVGSWPDSLPFKEDIEYPKSIIILAAQAIASRDLARQKAFCDYMKAHADDPVSP